MRVPRYLDYALRSLKYLLLLFFLYAIGTMSAPALGDFLLSPYNRVADIKMYLFFQSPGTTTVVVILFLGLLSFFITNFWCRYLCPYGALLTLTSALRLTRVERNIKQCENCHLCTKSCPNRVSVSTAKRVGALECTNCGVCVAACPHGALNISLKLSKFKLAFKQIVIAIIILGVFYFVPDLPASSARID